MRLQLGSELSDLVLQALPIFFMVSITQTEPGPIASLNSTLPIHTILSGLRWYGSRPIL